MACWKCGDAGYIPKYAHVAEGVCFACGKSGKKVKSERPPPPKTYDRVNLHMLNRDWVLHILPGTRNHPRGYFILTTPERADSVNERNPQGLLHFVLKGARFEEMRIGWGVGDSERILTEVYPVYTKAQWRAIFPQGSGWIVPETRNVAYQRYNDFIDAMEREINKVPSLKLYAFQGI